MTCNLWDIRLHFLEWLLNSTAERVSTDYDIFCTSESCWKHSLVCLAIQFPRRPCSSYQGLNSKSWIFHDGWIQPWMMDEKFANFETDGEVGTFTGEAAVATIFVKTTRGTSRVEESSIWGTSFSRHTAVCVMRALILMARVIVTCEDFITKINFSWDYIAGSCIVILLSTKCVFVRASDSYIIIMFGWGLGLVEFKVFNYLQIHLDA